MTPRFHWSTTAAGNRICTSGAYTAVLQWLGDRWEVRVRAPNGDVVAYDPKTDDPILLAGFTQQYICWQAALRDEMKLLEIEPWVDPWTSRPHH